MKFLLKVEKKGENLFLRGKKKVSEVPKMVFYKKSYEKVHKSYEKLLIF